MPKRPCITYADALAFMDFAQIETGGGCTVLQTIFRWDDKDAPECWAWITLQNEPRAPQSLDDAVTICTYQTDDGSNGDEPSETLQYDTLLACLEEIYGGTLTGPMDDERSNGPTL